MNTENSNIQSTPIASKNVEKFSFFPTLDISMENGYNINQLLTQIQSNAAWRLKIEAIRSLDGDALQKAKKNLPAFTASCFLPFQSRRITDDMDFEHTNLIQADFDESDDFDELYALVKTDPHARLVFRSPTLKVKALFQMNPIATRVEHQAAFESLSNYCVEMGYGKIDRACKDVARLCFVSYDPEALLKDAIPLSWSLPKPSPQSIPVATGTIQKDKELTLREFLDKHNVVIIGERTGPTATGSTATMLCVKCPWEDEHTTTTQTADAVCYEDPASGKWSFKCFHNHCEGHGWKDFRQQVAPVEEAYQGALSETHDFPNTIEDNKKIELCIQYDLDTLTTAIWEVWEKLEKETPTIFQKAGELYQVNHETKKAEVMTESLIHLWLAKRFSFVKYNAKREKSIVAQIPAYLLKALLEAVQPFVPNLQVIYNHPVILDGGECADKTGYYASIESYVFCDEAFDWSSVETSAEAIKAAKNLIFNDFLHDYIFENDESLGDYIAYLLTFALRPAINGNVPILAVSAPTAGAGKTKLLDLASVIWIGQDAPKTQVGSDHNNEKEEMRKRLMASLLESPENIVFDNAERIFSNPSLASALTTGRYTDRLLGASQMVEIDTRAIMAVTGNNLSLGGDMPRRAFWVRLGVDREKPETRTGFKYPMLDQWTLENRIPLMNACLSLIKSWVENGAKVSNKVLGSYEHWTQIVGGVMENAGIGGFLSKQADTESDELVAMRDFCHAVYSDMEDTEFTSKEVFEIASHSDAEDSEDEGILDAWLGIGKAHSRKIQLGKHLKRHANRFFGDYRLLKSSQKKDNRVIFQVIRITPDTESETPVSDDNDSDGLSDLFPTDF